MNVEIFLLVMVPAIIVATVLYAVVAEMRHNRVRRSRWDLSDDGRGNGGRVLEHLGSGD